MVGLLLSANLQKETSTRDLIKAKRPLTHYVNVGVVMQFI